MGLDLNTDGTIERAGISVTACAIGQAAAAIFLQDCKGRPAAEIARSMGSIESWLAGAGERPVWAGIGQLETARHHPGRHGAILLAWKAAKLALCKPVEAG